MKLIYTSYRSCVSRLRSEADQEIPKGALKFIITKMAFSLCYLFTYTYVLELKMTYISTLAVNDVDYRVIVKEELWIVYATDVEDFRKMIGFTLPLN